MFFELQLSANLFTRILRNRLKALRLCVNRELHDQEGNLLVVDKVVIGEATLIQREQTATQVVAFFPTFSGITVPFLQVKQEVSIHLVKSSDLDANWENPTSPFKILTIYPVYNVSLKVANLTQGGGPVSLSYSLAYIDFGLLVLGLSEEQRNEIQRFIVSAGLTLPPITLDFGSLTELLQREQPFVPRNAGISCDPAGTFVALRVDFDIYSSPVSLNRDFFEAGPINRLGTKEWAMIYDPNIFIQEANAKVRRALETTTQVRLNSGPNARWDPMGPAIDIGADIEKLDACLFFVDNIDMDAHINIRANFSVSSEPNPNTLLTHFHITANPSNALEVLACTLTTAFLWPFIGPTLVDLDIYFGGLASTIFYRFYRILTFIETTGLEENYSRRLGNNCTKLDDNNYECREDGILPIILSPPLQSSLVVDQVYGFPEGLVFAGFVRNLPDLPLDSVTVTATPLKWGITGSCRDKFGQIGRNGFFIVNQAQIQVTSTRHDNPICCAYVLSDPVNEFEVFVDHNFGELNIITVRPRFKPEYTSAPYPCRVRVVTTYGVRTITLQPPVAITDAERQELETLVSSFNQLCQTIRDAITIPDKTVPWGPPGPVEVNNFQFWQLVMKGMQSGDIVRVKGVEGEIMMTARPSREGIIHLSLMFPGDRAPSELSLELLRQEEESENTRDMIVQQIQFEHRASLYVRGIPHEMRFEGDARSRRLIIVDDDKENIWDVTTPIAPALLNSTDVSYLNKGRNYFVTHKDRRIGNLPQPNLRALERLKGRLELPECVGIPRVIGIGETLYVRTKTGATLYDVSNPEEPREIHNYDKEAWYENTSLGGRLMARYNPDSNIVDIYYATVTKYL